MRDKVLDAFIDRHGKNGDFVSRDVNDLAFQDLLFTALVKRLYDELRTLADPPTDAAKSA